MAFRPEGRVIMWKENKKTLIITSILILFPMIVGVIFWEQLPEQIAIHFGHNGEPNGWAGKWFAVVGLPVVLTALHLLCTFVTGTDPRYDKYPEKMKKIVLWICPVVSWIGTIGIYGYELKWSLDIMKWIPILLGVMFIFIGNYLPKIKQNLYLGIKLPWTYASEENWNKTHRMGGKVWVVGGVLLLCNFLLKIKYLEIVVCAAMILIPTVYSYLYSRKENQEK